MLRRSRTKILGLYLFLPLFMTSFLLEPAALAIVFGNSYSSDNSQMAGISAFHKLAHSRHPISLMTPAKSGDLYKEMASVEDLFVEFNEKCGSRFQINTYIYSTATVGNFKIAIFKNEKMHLSTHGFYDEHNYHNPVLNLYHGSLTPDTIENWNLRNGKCRLLYIGACNALGTGPYFDTDLIDALRSRTSIDIVLAFHGEVSILAATPINQSFWKLHGTYDRQGTLDSDVAYQGTKDKIEINLILLPIVAGASVGTLLGAIVAAAESGVGAAFVGELVSGVTTWVACEMLLGELDTAIHNWYHMGDTSISGYYWPYGGGGGGGGLPPRRLPY
ncbi:MAG: hypothetical protein DRO73_10000 [Candidatus Thorarchaeota archaeon]|nr:MAG: hypothetical protein DRO73_10000 [Candidatus Thorarchaeota archaeon]